MKKDIIFGNEALTQIAKGVEILAKTVGSTLGPGGRNVIFESLGFPLVTKDGVTVASQIELKDKLQNIGAQMVKQVAKKTCDDAGDGTTSSVVLANAILQEGLKVLSTGVNPIDMQRGINKAIEEVIKFIEEEIKVDVHDDLTKVQQIARVSANWDDELADVIANSITEVGVNGAIRLDENRGYQTKYTIVDGLQFDRGYVAAQFINNQAKQICEMDNPYVMFYAGELRDPAALLPLLKEAKRNDNANLFIIAEKYDPDILKQLVLSKTQSGVRVCAIKAPWYKDMCYDTLHDIAILMGGQVIDPSNPNSISLEDVRLRHCGRCDKAVCSLQRSSFVGFGNFDEEKKAEWRAALDARIKDIEELSKDETADKLPRENAKIRLKQINAKAAIISIGASSEVEYNEKLDRADDALRATRCAMTEGVVPGAGYCYLKATKCKGLTNLLNSDIVGEQVGAKIVQSALKVPFKKLLTNAGLEEEIGILMGKVINGKLGYNIKTQKLENLVESGVLDPWMVTKSALRNAGSVAGMILTSEAIVADEEELKTIDVSQKLPTM